MVEAELLGGLTTQQAHVLVGVGLAGRFEREREGVVGDTDHLARPEQSHPRVLGRGAN